MGIRFDGGDMEVGGTVTRNQQAGEGLRREEGLPTPWLPKVGVDLRNRAIKAPVGRRMKPHPSVLRSNN